MKEKFSSANSRSLPASTATSRCWRAEYASVLPNLLAPDGIIVVQTIANDPVMDVFAKLDLRTIALLLDVDGTIIDIGPSPTEVQVSEALLAVAQAPVRSDGRRRCAGQRPADRRSRSLVCAVALAGNRRAWRRNAPGRSSRYFIGQSRCRTICASVLLMRQASVRALSWRTRTIRLRCTTEMHRSRRSVSAVMSRQLPYGVSR